MSIQKARLGTGVYNALADAVKADGWKGLYRGLVPNLVGGAGSWGCYFLLCVWFLLLHKLHLKRPQLQHD